MTGHYSSILQLHNDSYHGYHSQIIFRSARHVSDEHLMLLDLYTIAGATLYIASNTGVFWRSLVWYVCTRVVPGGPSQSSDIAFSVAHFLIQIRLYRLMPATAADVRSTSNVLG